MAKNSINNHLKQLCKQANSIRKLGESISTEEFFIGVAGALLTGGVSNGREKIGKKRVKEIDNRTRKINTIEGDWKETE